MYWSQISMYPLETKIWKIRDYNYGFFSRKVESFTAAVENILVKEIYFTSLCGPKYCQQWDITKEVQTFERDCIASET